MTKNLAWAAAVLTLSLPVSTLPAQALELKVADSFPAGHYLVRLLLKPWMDDVTKRTNGAVTFTYYPNQQIGKAADMLRLTQSGVVDIGYIGPSYVSDKMPLSEVAQLPGAFATSVRWRSALVGAAIGLFAGATMNLHCPNVAPLHVLMGHGLPVVVATLLGALVLGYRTRA